MDGITPKMRERFLESSRLAGEWYLNCQNTPERPWGGVHESADEGRFIYEYFPTTGWCRGMGVWGQALAIMGLMTLARRVRGGDKYRKAAIAAGEYLKSLQCLSPLPVASTGGFCEHNPQTLWSYPRDAATGGMGMLALYRETGKTEYLDRARLFADWYHDHGSDGNGWPYVEYDLAAGRSLDADSGRTWVKGDWQAGGGLVYYWLYKLTGEEKWLGFFRQLIDPLIGFYERNAGAPVVSGFHGDVEISYGNDDFAIVALLAAYRHWREPRMLEALRGHMRRLWTIMDSDGSYPSYAGTFVCNINNLEYLQLAREERLDEDLDALEARILRTAEFGLTLQETALRDPRAYGGFYGQSEYGVSRDRIHHRDAGYAMVMYLRLVGGTETPYYSSYGWDDCHKGA